VSAVAHTVRVLAATVHVLDPIQRTPLILSANTEVTDSAIAEQITNPRCWQAGTPLATKTTRKMKSADS
jgi:hypothetical protein